MKKSIIAIFICVLFINNLKAQILLSENFEGTFPSAGWIIQNNGTGNNWTQFNDANYASQGMKSMIYAYNSANAANAWAFTPGISLNSGDVLLITFDQRVRGAIYSEKLKVTVGSAQNLSSQTTTLFDNGNLKNLNYIQRSINFVAPTTGVFYFAFNCYSAANQYNLYIDNLTIKRLGTDAAIISLLSPISSCSLNTTENISLTIKNVGTTTISDFPVSYSVNEATAITETVTTSIAPSATLNYTFTNTFDASAIGQYTIRTYVGLVGDIDHLNDTLVHTTENPTQGILTKSYSNKTNIPDKDSAGIAPPIYFCGIPTSLDGIIFRIASLTIDSIMHTYTSDLDIYLVSPSNDSVAICIYNGGSGDNILHAIFTDNATTNVSTLTSGGIPAGTYYPYNVTGFNSFYNGQNPNGAWKLRVIDYKATDFGKLHKWTLSFEEVTGVKEEKNNSSLVIYPNPTTGVFQLKPDKLQLDKYKIKVVDILGSEVLQLNNFHEYVDLSNQSNGVYFVYVYSDNDLIIEKVIVQK